MYAISCEANSFSDCIDLRAVQIPEGFEEEVICHLNQINNKNDNVDFNSTKEEPR
jgi:hypothetical protein